jgi:hypothetical protein
MISDPNTAKHISDLMRKIFYLLEESDRMVKETCSPEDIAAYQHAVGRILSPVFVEVLNPLYHQHPELKPPNWDD